MYAWGARAGQRTAKYGVPYINRSSLPFSLKSSSRTSSFERASWHAASNFFHLKKKDSTGSPGCFGLPNLHSPSDWNRIAQDCLVKCESLVRKIHEHRELDDASLLRIFDDLSNALCIVLDTAEVCRNAHSDPHFRKSATDAYFAVASVLQTLNSDVKLYNALSSVRDVSRRGGDASHFADEDKRMVESLARDFEKGGITLSESGRTRIVELQDLVNRLGFEFSTLPNKRNDVEIPLSVVTGLPAWFQRRIKGVKSGQYVVDSASLHFVLRNVDNSKHRELFFRRYYESYSGEALPILDDLISSRHELSNMLGFRSYASLQFEDRLGSSPEEVEEFLIQLNDVLEPLSTKELDRIRVNEESIMSWDYQALTKASVPEKACKTAHDVSQFLPLSAVLEGIVLVMREAFAVEIEHEKPVPSELWHESVKKYRAFDESGKLLGHIFLDLEPRPDKGAQAAHFTIRCGRSPGRGLPYQTPVVALVCSFARCSPSGEQLLTFDEYDTLWHELGHAMHSLLSRTKYQHLSGTRVPVDAVEIPSNVFQNFAWDPRVLSRVARHHLSGEPMPTRMLHDVCSQRNHLAVFDIRQQILMSVFDLQIHSEQPAVGRTRELFAKLQSRLSPYPPDCVPTYAMFPHLTTYGAGFYSYLFARIISTQLWSSLGFDTDPFSKEAGIAFREAVLAGGAAIPPGELLRTVLPSNVDCAPFLKSIGVQSDNLVLPIK